MKLRTPVFATLAAASVLFSACKDSSDSSSSGSPDGDGGKPDPAVDGYVLYSDKILFPAGTVVTKDNTMDMENMTITVAMGPQDFNGTMTRREEKQKKTTYVSDTEITIEYTKHKDEGVMEMNGQKMPQPGKINPLLGKTIVMTKADGKWSGKLKDGEATSGEQDKINDVAKGMNDDSDKEMYGEAPRKLGDTWEVDASKLPSFAGPDSEDMEGSCNLTFEAVEEVNGHECAVLVVDLDVKGKTKEGLNLEITGKVKVYLSLEYKTELKMVMDAKLKGGGEAQGGANMKMDGPMKGEDTATVKLP